MTVAGDLPERRERRRGGWVTRLIANPRFQQWASGFPLTRGIARRDGAEIFDIVQGFVQSQVLSAIVELDLLHHLVDGPEAPTVLARRAGMAEDRMAILLQAGAALGLFKRRRDGRFALARKGAAILGVPGLEAMIRHHSAFYADMADPVALLRGQGDTELARFWPYVFGAAAEMEPEVARRYGAVSGACGTGCAADGALSREQASAGYWWRERRVSGCGCRPLSRSAAQPF